MSFGTLEDLEGVFDLVIFAEPYAQYSGVLKAALEGDTGEDGEGGPVPLLLSGKLEAADPPKVLVSSVLPLDRADEKLSSQLRLRLTAAEATRDRLVALKGLLRDHPGECAVAVHVLIPGESETVVALPTTGVRPTDDLLKDLDGLFGRPVTQLAL